MLKWYYIKTSKGVLPMDIEVLRNLEMLGINAMYIHKNGISINLVSEDTEWRKKAIKEYIAANLITDEICHM